MYQIQLFWAKQWQSCSLMGNPWETAEGATKVGAKEALHTELYPNLSQYIGIYQTSKCIQSLDFKLIQIFSNTFQTNANVYFLQMYLTFDHVYT